MAWCYILFSHKLNKYYVGVTQESVSGRLLKHNTAAYSNTYTAIANDWVLFFEIECASMKQAMAIEKHIKQMKSTTYYRNLKQFPEIAHKLLKKYN
ncbi:MAG: GIY-YIG nuclease family protein [Chitinophagaceae bacterium]